MGKQAVELDQTLEPLVDDVVEFTKYAWLFRYPGDADEPSALEAGAVPHRVQAFVAAVTSRLSEEQVDTSEPPDPSN